MRTILISSLLLLTSCTSGTFRPGSVPRVSISQLSSEKDVFSRKLKNREELIISVKKGEVIPAQFTFDSGIVLYKSRESMTAQRDFCIYIGKGKFGLSPDCKTFAHFHKGSSLKKLFGFKRGSVSLGLKIDKEGISVPILIKQN
ncbi:hypothetical protein KKF34_03975 [Myxococcota bacterium]|nr:hypothetical protein [Myxococcota bacterium]MBU1381497.1 hypothetical protein [Myxococcota bacterium]MBU1496014.1 hypothetical protein [Myxococcota bacterium]